MPVPDTASDLAPGLTYVSDALPGLRRQRRGKGFRYVDPRGRTVSAAERARILALGIPPAWEDVWICRDPGGHIQATGLDAAGRKQYRYHPGWSDWRARSKYDGLAGFGAGLARFRARVARDLAGRRATSPSPLPPSPSCSTACTCAWARPVTPRATAASGRRRC